MFDKTEFKNLWVLNDLPNHYSEGRCVKKYYMHLKNWINAWCELLTTLTMEWSNEPCHVPEDYRPSYTTTPMYTNTTVLLDWNGDLWKCCGVKLLKVICFRQEQRWCITCMSPKMFSFCSLKVYCTYLKLWMEIKCGRMVYS